MTTHVDVRPGYHAHLEEEHGTIATYLVPLARALFSAVFIIFAAGLHFSPAGVAYAESQGVPLASIVVPLSGVMAVVGGLSVALGFHAKGGAWLLVLFLLPVTLMMHRFWTVTDPAMAQIQQAMFLKNLSMLGGALLIAYFGAGPASMDASRRA